MKKTRNILKKQSTQETTPKEKENSKKKVWRPEIMTQEIIEKILEALSQARTVRFACKYAWISVYTYYKYKEKYPDFSERTEEAFENSRDVARQGLYTLLKAWDPATIRWYLQKTDPEFKDFILVGNGQDIKPMNPQEEKELLSFIPYQ